VTSPTSTAYRLNDGHGPDETTIRSNQLVSFSGVIRDWTEGHIAAFEGVVSVSDNVQNRMMAVENSDTINSSPTLFLSQKVHPS
jgi:hypothetical protein